MPRGRVVRPSGTTADGNLVALRNATLVSVDSTEAEAVPGYVQTVQKDNFVAVVATDEWAAIQAANALVVTWSTCAPLITQAVRVQWMRQDEHGWEPLGPAMAHSMKGGLDSNGNVVAWDHAVYTPTHNSRPAATPTTC